MSRQAPERAARPHRPAVTALIPHRPPILMVEEIVEADGEKIVCRGVLPCSSPFLALELTAQTAAVMAALEGEGTSSEAAVGYLAAIHDARFLVPDIPRGRPVLATVEKAGSCPPLRRYKVSVALEKGAVELIRATLSTYLAR